MVENIFEGAAAVLVIFITIVIISISTRFVYTRCFKQPKFCGYYMETVSSGDSKITTFNIYSCWENDSDKLIYYSLDKNKTIHVFENLIKLSKKYNLYKNN